MEPAGHPSSSKEKGFKDGTNGILGIEQLTPPLPLLLAGFPLRLYDGGYAITALELSELESVFDNNTKIFQIYNFKQTIQTFNELN